MTTRLQGVLSAGGVLDRIVEAKARRLELVKRNQIDDEISVRARRSFAEALSGSERINIIAEIKRRSPSKGMLRENFNPSAIALSYERAGAAAISVLTEEDFFDGSIDHLAAVRASVSIPILRKDFIFDEHQIREAARAGADALLLIVAILDDELLRRLIDAAHRAGLDALVEVHTAQEMERAVRAGARIIGVNNRDLTTFNVTLETSTHLARLAPAEALLVSESGISTRDDIDRLREAGFKAFLIGEHFMRADDPGESLVRLVNG
ncbi:MAG TPA: indole-3-glycerol phosphate synthase TrpC [Blastocatellia bacterium]